MKTFGNILWFIFGGIIQAAIYFLLGVVFCVTLIGIPLAKQYFKLAKVAFWPIGKEVEVNYESHGIMNTVWFALGGFLGAVIYSILAVVFCVTIIGIPFGRQFSKLAKLCKGPFGAIVE